MWTLWSTRFIKMAQVIVLEKRTPFFLFRCGFNTGIALVCCCPPSCAMTASLQDQLSEAEGFNPVKLTGGENEATWGHIKTQLHWYSYTQSAPVLVCRSPRHCQCFHEVGRAKVDAREAAVRWLWQTVLYLEHQTGFKEFFDRYFLPEIKCKVSPTRI